MSKLRLKRTYEIRTLIDCRGNGLTSSVGSSILYEMRFIGKILKGQRYGNRMAFEKTKPSGV